MDKPATFKGKGNGIVILLNPNEDFNTILEYLKTVLNERRIFFSGADLTIDPNGIELSEYQINRLIELFKQFGITFSIIGKGVVSQREVIKPTSKNENASETLIINHTLRAGQMIKFDGNVVILGDINEGAEVEVSGSAYIFGMVRGIVNAGESVVSLGFKPLRMIIGKVVFDNNLSGKTYRKPRIAKVENGKVVVRVLSERKSIRR